jgi:hypothetical protein
MRSIRTATASSRPWVCISLFPLVVFGAFLLYHRQVLMRSSLRACEGTFLVAVTLVATGVGIGGHAVDSLMNMSNGASFVRSSAT